MDQHVLTSAMSVSAPNQLCLVASLLDIFEFCIADRKPLPFLEHLPVIYKQGRGTMNECLKKSRSDVFGSSLNM